MKISIVSDTHGYFDAWDKLYREYLQASDLILHAGDVLYYGPRNPIVAGYNPQKLAEALNQCSVPVIVAQGNCDSEVDSMVLAMPVQSPYSYVVVNGMRIVVNHGHTFKDEEALFETAKHFKAHVIITGHTHIARLNKRDGIIHLNPGSPVRELSKREDGSATLATLYNGKITITDVASGEVIQEELITGGM